MKRVHPPVRALRWALSVVVIFACAHSRDEASGPDAVRISASQLKLEETVDDTVDAREGDATDWRYFELEKHGQIIAQLHWDNPEARLGLTLADNLGKELAHGEPWGNNSRQVVFADADPGRYFVRVQAEDDSRRTPYSLRVQFQQVQPGRCHSCTVGQAICVGRDGYTVCEESKQGCNAWGIVLACGADQTCRDGACAAGCRDQCRPDERRCVSRSAVQACKRGAGGCLHWDDPIECESGQACESGNCRRAPVAKEKERKEPPPTPSRETPSVRGEIYSVYNDGGQRMLWVKIGENNPVQAGMSGVVLDGTSNDPLPNGDIKVVSVSGQYVKASTKLESVGTNRRVSIRLK